MSYLHSSPLSHFSFVFFVHSSSKLSLHVSTSYRAVFVVMGSWAFKINLSLNIVEKSGQINSCTIFKKSIECSYFIIDQSSPQSVKNNQILCLRGNQPVNHLFGDVDDYA
ncbi:unnamed protein product [Cuscuta epithymum]|uniref:Uncharacterized protein n=1 Tax=Cuscuta epithymum TaxID=186058 RepID=A0AAV0BY87_9ASTE|nr:unnamed protein product [Cuscuta epithymum]